MHLMCTIQCSNECHAGDVGTYLTVLPMAAKNWLLDISLETTGIIGTATRDGNWPGGVSGRWDPVRITGRGNGNGSRRHARRGVCLVRLVCETKLREVIWLCCHITGVLAESGRTSRCLDCY